MYIINEVSDIATFITFTDKSSTLVRQITIQKWMKHLPYQEKMRSKWFVINTTPDPTLSISVCG